MLRKIQEIEATSSRTEKEELLADLALTDEGRFILKWTYDPFVTYGITPPRQKGEGMVKFRPTLVQPMLENLASRKLSGNAAQREVAEVMQAFDEEGAEILWRILSKDLKCGVAESTVNRVVPGLIPVFSVMRAHKFEEKRIKEWPVFVEPKYDGYRFTFLCRDGHGGFFTRSGLRAPSADHLVEPMIETALFAYQDSVARGTDLWRVLTNSRPDARSNLSFMADGEMIMSGNFNANGALRRQDEQAIGARFHVFDLMSYADFDATGSVGRTYVERRKLVDQFVGAAKSADITKSERYFAHSLEEIHELYEKFRARGLEGAMVKLPNGLYDKKKSYGWLKIKAEDTEDLPIVGVFYGEANTKNVNTIGGIIVLRANGVEVRVSGISDDLRAELLELWEHDAKLCGLAGPEINVGFKPGISFALDEIPAGVKLLGRLVEIEFHEETPDGSLRHPRFKRFRDDKAGEIESKEAA